MSVPFEHRYAALPERFRALSPATAVGRPTLLALNRALAEALSFDVDYLQSEAGLALLAGNASPDGSTPVAMAYAGHQFGQFVPQLGDGRALLLGERLDRDGNWREVQLKGAGRTPFSRSGDGRNWYGPVLREYLLSEAMHALGVPTTRSLAALATGEPVQRERALPGAILVRVARSHVRVGSFQYFAARGDTEAIRILLDYCIENLYPELKDSENKALAFFRAVCERQARLIAEWLAVGFVHGVMNTDNMAISGETIDYGPCAFLDHYDVNQVFSSIDRAGRYAYGRQPGIGKWNLAQLAQCLLPLIDAEEAVAIEQAQAELEHYDGVFHAHWLQRQARKLGLAMAGDGNDADPQEPLLFDWLQLLQHAGLDYTLAHVVLGEQLAGSQGRPALPAEAIALLAPTREALFAAGAQWLPRWRQQLSGREAVALEGMRGANPLVIPRNHQVERVIEAAVEREDLSVFHAMLAVLQDPFRIEADQVAWMAAPQPEERVLQTFCGT